jgi:hypothetical protein
MCFGCKRPVRVLQGGDYALPPGWQFRQTGASLSYQLEVGNPGPDPMCTVTFVTLGSALVVWGLVQGQNTLNISLGRQYYQAGVFPGYENTPSENNAPQVASCRSVRRKLEPVTTLTCQTALRHLLGATVPPTRVSPTSILKLHYVQAVLPNQ